MELKKIYDIPEGWQREYEGLADFEAFLAQSRLTPEQQAVQLETFKRTARVVNIPPQKGIEVINTGSTPYQNWGRDFVEQGLKGGWVSVGQSMLTLHTRNAGDLAFAILKVPGTYCCHCDAQLEDDPTGQTGRWHVQSVHGETPSPDPQNPLGFRYTHAYETELDPAQHAQLNYHAVRAAKEQGRTVTPPAAAAPASPAPASVPASGANGTASAS